MALPDIEMNRTLKPKERTSRPRHDLGIPFIGKRRLRFGPRRREVGLMHLGLRIEHGHVRIDPHADERGIFRFVRPNPHAVQAGARYGIPAVENEIKHDPLH